MRSPKQPCPRCNAEQSFRPRREPGDRPDTIVVFIACTVCRWRVDLRTSTAGLEVLYDRRRRLLERARVERERHGVESNATRRLLAQTSWMLTTARLEAGL